MPAAGDKLGPYEILGQIGKGGMGEVFRARDTRLDREVAMKFSAERFSERFEREARAIAALNHSNICHLYDIGPDYLVIEMVEGPTLADVLKSGALPLDEALNIARQIANALEAAHEKGITHRDLKPGNIKIRPDGTVKVLDFGLAKLGGTPTAQSGDSPTLSMGRTEAGMILGTAAYMSPEQAKGRPVDQRADIYAFGAVLFEMVTGQQLHGGEATTEVLAAVIKEDPDWTKVPPQLQTLLRRCLEKDPQRRLRHIGDVMDLVSEAPAAAPPAPAASATQPGWLWKAIAALAAAAAATLAILYFRPAGAPPPEITRFDLTQPKDVDFSDSLAVSPDGRKLAFTSRGLGSPQIWIRSLDVVEARPLPGTEGVAGIPFWSPDGRYLAFASSGKLQKIDVSGGPPQVLCDVPAALLGGMWTPDGKLVFGINSPSPLLQVSANGGTASPLVLPGDKDPAHAFPALLPDRRHFVYLAITGQGAAAIDIASLDAAAGGPEVKRLLSDISSLAFGMSGDPGDQNGYLLFGRRTPTLLAQRLDLKRLELSGEAVPIGDQVSGFAASKNGVLVFRTGTALSYRLSWFDRQGKPLEKVGDVDVLPTPAPALSPDGKQVAVSRTDSQSGNTDIWLYEFARGLPTRLTFDAQPDIAPVWSPDGRQIAFVRGTGAAGGDIYERASDMSGSEQLLLKSGGLPVSWSHDGRFLLYQTTVNPKTRTDIMVLPLTGPADQRKPWPFAKSEFIERGPRFSPDGRFVSYVSDESGKGEVYVRPFDPSASGGSSSSGPRWQISKDGGDGAHWRADGREIVYMAPGSTLMSVEVSTAPVFHAGVPKALFKSAAVAQFWDLTPDAKRLLVPVPAGAASSAAFRVTLNWTTMLRR